MEINLEDFNRCCRCCLAIVNVLKPIFGVSLNNMLSELMDIQITQNDGYPQQICFQCVLKLSSSYTFYTMAMKSHKMLEEILKTAENKNNGEPSIDPKRGKELGTLEKNINTMEVEMNTSEKQNGCRDRIPSNQDLSSSKTLTEKQNAPKILERSECSSDKEDDYHCSQCQYDSKDQGTFEAHLRTHLVGIEHMPKGEADSCPQLCNICGARFRWRTSLLKHLRQHRGRHKCEVCHKVFGEASTLNVHMVRHSANQKPYTCETCNKSFTQQSSLKKHAQTHDTRAQLRCGCGKKFLYKHSYLRHHENIHSPTECPLCKNIFVGKKLLDSHMKFHNEDIDGSQAEMLTDNSMSELINVHTVSVQFLCLICTQKFQTKESLEVHVCSTDKIT